jgi:hypothetical protein
MSRVLTPFRSTSYLVLDPHTRSLGFYAHERRFEQPLGTPVTGAASPSGGVARRSSGQTRGLTRQPDATLRQGGVSMYPRRSPRSLRLSIDQSRRRSPPGLRARRIGGSGPPAPHADRADRIDTRGYFSHQSRALGSSAAGLEIDGRQRRSGGAPGQHAGRRSERCL